MTVRYRLPDLPSALASVEEVSRFVHIYNEVQQQESNDSDLQPLELPVRVLAVTNGAISMVTPSDVTDPFVNDSKLRSTLARRHVLLLTEESTKSGHYRTLDGQTLVEEGGDGDNIKYREQGGGTSTEARKSPVDKVLILDRPLIDLVEVTEAIGRHPQINPFKPE